MRSRNSLLLLMGLLGLVGPGWACDDPKYAKYEGKNHVMCVKSPTNCPQRHIVERELTDHDKRSLVNLFNIFRSLAATGKLGGYPPAMKMEQLTWDEELATLTKKIATFCEKLDQFDVSVDRFDVVQFHEELKQPYNATVEKDKMLLKIVFDIFRRAFDHTYPANNLENYDPSLNTITAGFLTQLLWDRTKYVGCGYRYHVYKRTSGYRKLFCIFGPAGNVKGEPVYRVGEPNCEKESKEFPGLCVTEEDEQKFLPLPCEDKELNVKYKSALCTFRSELYRWIGRGFVGNTWVCDDPKYAKYMDLNHVMCNESPSSCVGNLVKERGLTDHDRRALLYFINMFRSVTATGKLSGFPPASNMQQLTWDDELANLTNKMSYFCNLRLNQYDLTVDRFKVSQFFEEITEDYDQTTEKDKKIFEFTRDVFKSAFDKNVYRPYNSPRYHEPRGNKKLVADSLIQLLWGRSKYIGCGYWYRYHKSWSSHTRLLFCAFGPAGKVKGELVYKVGEPSCERESNEFPGLCVTEEDEKKFLPLPCEDNEFNATYGMRLCAGREKMREKIIDKFVGHGWDCNDPKYAGLKRKNHVMCATPPNKCYKLKFLVQNLTDHDKGALLYAFNLLRSWTASGNTTNYPSASNMQQLTWDDELATMAQRAFSFCENYDFYNYALSENRFEVSLVYLETTEKYDMATEDDKRLLEFAFDMYKRAINQTDPKKHSTHNTKKEKGQLLWDRNKYVGCGYRYHTESDSRVTGNRKLLCLFGPAVHVEGESMYSIGEPSCEKESKEFPGLCVTEETEQKFLPLPCEDSEFNATYGTPLCASREEQSKWIRAEKSCHDPKYAKFKDRNHVMCAETPASCPKKKIIDRNITDYDKRALLYTLNVFRSLTATGQTGGYPAAVNMQQLTWDEELATLANKMSTLCNNLEQYDVSVERFDVSQFHEDIIEGFDSTTAKEKKILDIALQVYNRVFDRTYPARFLAKYNSSRNPDKANGLTQLLWDRTKYVGCGFRFHIDLANTAYRKLFCLFGPAGNVEGEPVYEMGEPDCDRESSEFDGLCLTEEDEKKSLPIPCNDCDFKWMYGKKLCSSKKEMYKWMGKDVPFPYLNCWDNWWRRRVRAALYAFFTSAVLLAFWHAYLSDKLCFPIRIFLV
ncbi:Hypothetical predicted protein [Cloeon dipterum]|uniref:SCP domain-containing protein n=1 Tax=Cloeon dipterum TaxID=197152 RepID=A0A8S1D3X1_9INSE|nr:Hypothetical predicted protein [Cloeon dipterum]